MVRERCRYMKAIGTEYPGKKDLYADKKCAGTVSTNDVNY